MEKAIEKDGYQEKEIKDKKDKYQEKLREFQGRGWLNIRALHLQGPDFRIREVQAGPL